jgi:HEAT repeat protein
MPAPRFVKSLAALALFNGLLYLTVAPAWANPEEDAKKYTQDLKKSKDAKVRINALNELGKLVGFQRNLANEAMPDIYKALEDKDAGVRAAAAKCLGACGQPADKAVPALLKMLKDDKEDAVKMAAAIGLGSMGKSAKAALPTLRELAADKKSKLGGTAKAAMKAITAKE